jgi:Xaa-Pro aminopeptidase
MRLLQNAESSAFLVSNLVNIRYLTGLSLSAGLLLVLGRRYHLFVDDRYQEYAQKETFSDVTVHPLSAAEETLSKVRKCAIEAQDVTLTRYASWKRKFKNTKFVHLKDVIEEFRRQKSDEELRLFRRSQRITREMIARVPSALRTHTTERKIAWQLRVWAEELGADDVSFEPIVAFGTNSSRPHHHPTDRALKRGHIVQIDCGVKYRGYCSDQSHVFFTGKATDEMRRIFGVVLEAKEKAIKEVRPGVTNRALDTVAEKVLATHGLAEFFTHALGHGVGLEIHEGISISQRAPETVLLKNEIITIEPGVYIPGKFGIRLEEEVIVH